VNWMAEEAALRETAERIGWTVEQVVAALNADAELPEAAYLECRACSIAGGADMPVHHLPPLCATEASRRTASPSDASGSS